MTLQQECALSYYAQVAEICPARGVFLVQHRETRKFYVKKQLTVYSLAVYEQLRSHPIAGMPRIYELAEEAGRLTVIEEYLAGSTLEELLAKNGPFPAPLIAGWMRQLCGILNALHTAVPPILHRDIKPSNIILSPDGRIKLLDMDAAKIYEEGKPRDTVLMGTAGFAAPEQYGFSASTVQTDIYALGVLMNMLATGALPQERPCAGPLGPLIARCTRLEPAGRYASVQELSAALAPLAAAQPAAAAPRPTLRRFLPPGFRSRNPLYWLLSLLGYGMVVSVCLSTTLDGRSTGPGIIPYRITTAVILFSMILFSGNYLGVQRYFPLCASPRRGRHLLGVLLGNLIIFMVCVVFISFFP